MQMCPYCNKVYDESEYSKCPFCHGTDEFEGFDIKIKRLNISEIYKKSVEKANAMCCPDCESPGTLEYADDKVLVCSSCGYSIDAEDLQPEWQEKIEDEL